MKNSTIKEIKQAVKLGAKAYGEDYLEKYPLHSLFLAKENKEKYIITALQYKEKNLDSLNQQDPDGSTLLHLAISVGKAEVAKYLINIGVDVKVKDREEKTPLHIAAAVGLKEIVEELVKKGVDINSRDEDGQTPLFWAIETKDLEFIKFMTSLPGIDINAISKYNANILHTAVIIKKSEIVEHLIKIGVNPMQKDISGNTPCQFASEKVLNSSKMSENYKNVSYIHPNSEEMKIFRMLEEYTPLKTMLEEVMNKPKPKASLDFNLPPALFYAADNDKSTATLIKDNLTFFKEAGYKKLLLEIKSDQSIDGYLDKLESECKKLNSFAIEINKTPEELSKLSLQEIGVLFLDKSNSFSLKKDKAANLIKSLKKLEKNVTDLEFYKEAKNQGFELVGIDAASNRIVSEFDIEVKSKAIAKNIFEHAKSVKGGVISYHSFENSKMIQEKLVYEIALPYAENVDNLPYVSLFTYNQLLSEKYNHEKLKSEQQIDYIYTTTDKSSEAFEQIADQITRKINEYDKEVNISSTASKALLKLTRTEFKFYIRKGGMYFIDALYHSNKPEAHEKIEQMLKKYNIDFTTKTLKDGKEYIVIEGVNTPETIDKIINAAKKYAKDFTVKDFVNAAVKGNEFTIKLVIDEKKIDINDENGSALYQAISFGHINIVKLLLSNGATIANKNIFAAGLLSGKDKEVSKEIYNLLKSTKNQEQPSSSNKADINLINAAVNGHLVTLKAILSKKEVDINAENGSALYQAIINGRKEVTEELLKNGAIISDKHIFAAGLLASSKNLDTAKEFYKILNEYQKQKESENKLKYNHKDLLEASITGNLATVKVILEEKKLDVNAENGSVLYQAVANGRKEVTEELLKNGATVTNKHIFAAGKLSKTKGDDVAKEFYNLLNNYQKKEQVKNTNKEVEILTR